MKILFYLFCFLALPVLLHGQSFKGIITAGANACQIDGDRLSGYYKPGFMLGVGVEKALHPRWSILLGVEFMEKGSKTSPKDSINFFRWKMHYLDIPVTLSFKAHPRFRFQAGLTPSVLLNDKVDNGSGYLPNATKDDVFHLLMAPAVEFFPVENISLLMRYQYSLIRFNSQVPNTVPKFHNLITVGVRLYLSAEEK